VPDGGRDAQGVELAGNEGFEVVGAERFSNGFQVFEGAGQQQQGVSSEPGGEAGDGGGGAAEGAGDLAMGGAGVEGGGDSGSESWELGVVGAGEGLLGEGALAEFAAEALDTAAVSGSVVEAEAFEAEAVRDTVLGAFGPGAVRGAEPLVGDVFDGTVRPEHGGKGRQAACRE
jgi:hypothetical protein